MQERGHAACAGRAESDSLDVSASRPRGQLTTLYARVLYAKPPNYQSSSRPGLVVMSLAPLSRSSLIAEGPPTWLSPPGSVHGEST